MKPWEKGQLVVSDNRRYLCNGKQPFFWLADTAWLLFQQCSLEEAYVDRDVTKPAFWEHCDKVVKMAEELGLYMGLLPSWGGNGKGRSFKSGEDPGVCFIRCQPL